MYSVSAGFVSELRSSSMDARSSVMAIYPNGTSVALTLAGGSVTLDATRSIARTCDLEFVPVDMSMATMFDLLSRPDIEIEVSRGLVVNGAPELVPLGVFSIDGAPKSLRNTGTIKWSGSDRSKKIARARFTEPYQLLSGTALGSAITALLQSRWALVATDFSNVTETLTATVLLVPGPDSDPWKSAREIMADFGYDLYFDGVGVARARRVPDPSTDPAAFDFGSGATALITDGEVSGSFEKTYNGVVASGEGTGIAAPVQATVWDTDPQSPTYYLGGFGMAPFFYSSPLLTTVDACTTVATAMLVRVKGKSLAVNWSSIVNPALEPLDVVTATYDGAVHTAVVDSLTIPLRASEVMRCVVRETRVTI
ncbi:MAG: DUF5047 domain-containing protein [Patescibacteria group bacterium]|nr:DUF5047 domain-containing protein [Patescibacteria group bacterium]